MAKKKSIRNKKAAGGGKKIGVKRKIAPRKPAAKRKIAARKPAAKRKTARRKPAARARPARKKKPAARKKSARNPPRPAAKKRATASVRKKPFPRSRPYLEEDEETTSADFDLMEPPTERGLGLESGGQSGDTEGLSRAESAASESVEELVEEGQAFEAGVISGVENAPDADEGGVRTREVPEDDVPREYLDQD